MALIVLGAAIGFGEFLAISQKRVLFIVLLGVAVPFWVLLCVGFFTLQPNVGAVLILFGKYKGTVASSGFHWANPLFIKKKVSLRAHNLNGEKLKVNDLRGNPLEIALVVVWRVVNTAKAVFDVADYADYVHVQSESALRHLAMAYSYDTFEGETLSLRGSVDEVSAPFRKRCRIVSNERGCWWRRPASATWPMRPR